MGIRCRIILNDVRREEHELAAIPRVDDTITFGIGGKKCRVDSVMLVANGRQGLDPEAVIYTTEISDANRP